MRFLPRFPLSCLPLLLALALPGVPAHAERAVAVLPVAELPATSAPPAAPDADTETAPSPHADPDQVLAATGSLESYRRLIQPWVDQARAGFPAVQARFHASLPVGQRLFVTVLLSDSEGRHEQVFVIVDAMAHGQIVGRIWNQLEEVQGHLAGDQIVLPEAEVLDWTITHRNGREEGNAVGKFLDAWQERYCVMIFRLNIDILGKLREVEYLGAANATGHDRAAYVPPAAERLGAATLADRPIQPKAPVSLADPTLRYVIYDLHTGHVLDPKDVDLARPAPLDTVAVDPAPAVPL